MQRCLILIILSFVAYSSCDPQCKTCLSNSSDNCISCYIYIKSCRFIEPNNLFLPIGILIIIVHLIMILLGYGVYRNIYQNIQMLSLLGWGYGSQSGANQLIITNFGIAKDNNFVTSYGAQFFIAISVISIFIILVSSVNRLPHNSMATLIKRKKIIFPLRI